MKTDRFISTTINNSLSQSMVISGAYVPCFVNNLDYVTDASAVIACTDNILALNITCWYIINGYFNFDCVPLNNNFSYVFFGGCDFGL